MMSHAAQRVEPLDELNLDRLPGMPLLGFIAGTLLSLSIWGTVVLVAWALS
jgi:hypothetical protein